MGGLEKPFLPHHRSTPRNRRTPERACTLKVPTQKRNETKNELSWQNEYFFSSSAIVPTTPSERSQNCRCIHHHRSNIAERRLVYVTKDYASNESYSILYVGDASRIWVYGGFHFSRVFFDDDV